MENQIFDLNADVNSKDVIGMKVLSFFLILRRK